MAQSVSPPWSTTGRDTTGRLSIRLNKSIHGDMTTLVDAGLYQTLAELVRDGLRRVLRSSGEPQVFGASLDSGNKRCVYRVPPEMVAGVEALAEDEGFSNKSDVVRDGIYRVLDDYEEVLEEGSR